VSARAWVSRERYALSCSPHLRHGVRGGEGYANQRGSDHWAEVVGVVEAVEVQRPRCLPLHVCVCVCVCVCVHT